jgi:Flp pilus assembly protein TadB
LSVLTALCAAAAVACLGGALRPRRAVSLPVELARASTLSPREAALAAQARRPLWHRLLAPLAAAVAPRLRPRWSGIGADELRRAGIDPATLGPAEVVTLKLLGGAGGTAAGLLLALLLPPGALLVPALGFAGFVAPSVVIGRRRTARRHQLLRELPDLVGLLTAFVSAGVPLEQALHLISARQAAGPVPNLLAGELRTALGDYGLGTPIDAALEAMARRTGLVELELFTAALAQAKRQGTGLERILRDQQTVVRLQQRNRAAAEASRVGTRLVGVLVLVYLPEFMVLIMVPLFYGIFLRAFG